MSNLSIRFIKAHLLSTLVFVLSLVLSVIMIMATWDIPFWPTDAEDYYLSAAETLSQVRFISEVHREIDDERIRLAHGKEIFFLCISFVQRILNDVVTLRPIMLVCIFSLVVSGILIYQLSKSFWGTGKAFVVWFLFIFSAWPYMYVLFAKHQLTGLMFFLGSVFFLIRSHGPLFKRWAFCLLAGIWLGLSCFSSTASPLYGPYFLAAFFYRFFARASRKDGLFRLRAAVAPAVLMLAGLAGVIIYVNLPHVVENIRGFWEYVRISGRYNHFFYNQPFLQQWFEKTSVGTLRGGWLWILKYFMTMMPVLFPFYGLAVIYLSVKAVWIKAWPASGKLAGMILLSLAACMMAETAGVAQYGANYFPALIGLLALIGFALDDVSRHGLFFMALTSRQRLWLKRSGVAVLGLHLIINALMFWGDIYPCRMAKRYVSAKIRELQPQRIFTYPFHPQRKAFLPYLDQDIMTDLSWSPIQTLVQAREGVVLLPPVTGDSIYIAATSPYIHFDQDLFLNTLIQTGQLPKYALASYRTLASSRFWLHEEEILTYRRLILGHGFENNRSLGRIWILDAERLSRDLGKFSPQPEELYLMREDMRRIGTKKKFLVYRGDLQPVPTPLNLRRLRVTLQKIGSPRDSLRAYVYKLDDQQPVWIPAAEHFYSLPLLAVEISADPTGQQAEFRFDPPLRLTPGPHYIVIYRTGQADDDHYYLVRRKDLTFPPGR